MRKYCCEKFTGLWEVSSEMGLNIRVVKLDNEYKFWMTGGYYPSSENVKRVLISFCPFCGQNLSQNYSKDEYINEEVEVLKEVFSRLS